jgi:hypothetical protein
MAAVDEIKTDQSGLISKETVSYFFWLFYHNNQNFSIKTKVWFVSVSIKMSQLKPLFEMMFGPDPITGNG